MLTLPSWIPVAWDDVTPETDFGPAVNDLENISHNNEEKIRVGNIHGQI